MKQKKYMTMADLEGVIQQDIKTWSHLKQKEQKVKSQMKRLKEDMSTYEDRIKDALGKYKVDGIRDDEGEVIVYRKEGYSAPSFKQVIEEARGLIGDKVIKTLWTIYEKLMKRGKKTTSLIYKG